MDNISKFEFLVLVLLKKTKNFRDSPSLIKILNWKFGFLEVRELLQKLQDDGLITKPSQLYEITTLGDQLIKQHFEEGRNLLLNSFPLEREFILSVFDNYPE